MTLQMMDGHIMDMSQPSSTSSTSQLGGTNPPDARAASDAQISVGAVRMRSAVHGLGSGTIGLASIGITAGIGRRLWIWGSTLGSGMSVDEVVGAVLMVIGLLIGVWLSVWAALSSIYLMGAALGYRVRRIESLIVRHGPVFLRRLVATTFGLSLTVAVSPAFAAGPLLWSNPPEPIDLGWSNSAPATSEPATGRTTGTPAPIETPSLAATPGSAGATPGPVSGPASGSLPPIPARPTTESAAERGTEGGTAVVHKTSTAPDRGTPKATRGDEQVVVRTGDSLWSIAAAHLASGATDAEIAASWPRWYRANADVIGPDPDRVYPGQVLRTP